MKLTYALLRKQRTHNLRYIVRTLLMKLAPDFSCLADELADQRPDMNIKVTAFTVSEKSIISRKDCKS